MEKDEGLFAEGGVWGMCEGRSSGFGPLGLSHASEPSLNTKN